MGQMIVNVPQDINLVYYVDDWDYLEKYLKCLEENADKIENIEITSSGKNEGPTI